MYLLRLDSYLRSDRRPKLVRKGYFLVLKILSRLFFLGYLARKESYKFRIFGPIQASCPVISIGNLSWGGTGKTPLVIYLASKLEKKGKKIVILTRGYARKSKEQIVLSAGNLQEYTWPKCGDEPYLICQTVPNATLIVNSNRVKAARWAGENLRPDLFLLDDGFQHWQLHRDLDIVLVDCNNPFGNHKLIPWGILREPVSALSRADLVILTKILDFSLAQKAKLALLPYAKNEIIQTTYRLSSVWDLESKKEVKLESLSGKKVLAFCGIGNPNSFNVLLKRAGLRIEKQSSFPDHYPYSNLDLLTLEKEGLKLGADYLATTAKDGLKIPDNLQLKLPALIFEIEVEVISGEEHLWQKINQIL